MWDKVWHTMGMIAIGWIDNTQTCPTCGETLLRFIGADGIHEPSPGSHRCGEWQRTVEGALSGFPEVSLSADEFFGED